MFARKGYAQATVEDIADEAGFTSGAVYAQFASKEALFLEVMSERATGRIGDAGDILADPERDLGELGCLITAAAADDPDFAALTAEFWLYAMRNPQALAIASERTLHAHQQIAEVLTEALRRRGIAASAETAESVATVVLSLFQGLVHQHRIVPELVPTELFGRAVELIFNGLRADAT